MYPWSLTVNLEVLKLKHLLRFWLAAKVLCLERMGYINTDYSHPLQYSSAFCFPTVKTGRMILRQDLFILYSLSDSW